MKNRAYLPLLACLLAVMAFSCSGSRSSSSDDAGGGNPGYVFSFSPQVASASPGDTISFTLEYGTPPYQFGYMDPSDIESYSDASQIQATFDSETGAGSYTAGPNDDCTDRLAAQDSTGGLCYLTITVGTGGGGGGGTGQGSGGSGGQTGLYSVSISGRTTSVYCPESYSSSQTWPVIVNLPGLGDSGYNAMSKWLPGVSPYPAEGYILVGCQLQTWPMEPEDVPTTADYQYVLACIDYVRSKYNVNLNKTLLVGFSRGATMAF
jgi:plastocyanin